MHVDTISEHGVQWTDSLAREYRQSITSVARGKGPARQSAPVCLEKTLSLKSGTRMAIWYDSSNLGMRYVVTRCHGLYTDKLCETTGAVHLFYVASPGILTSRSTR